MRNYQYYILYEYMLKVEFLFYYVWLLWIYVNVLDFYYQFKFVFYF